MTQKPSNASAGAGIAAGVALGAVAVGAAAIFVGSQCLQLVRTKSGMARVKKVRDEAGNQVRVLQQGGVYQSATYLDERRFEPVFAYYRAFDRMFDAEASKRAATGGERIAADRLRLITADARTFISQALAEGTRYDAVVNDCFAGCEPVRALATVEALCQVKVCLNPGGLYLANVVSAAGGENIDFLRDAVATAAAVFSHVHVAPCEDAAFGAEDNYLLIATDGAYSFHGELSFDEALYGEVMRDV